MTFASWRKCDFQVHTPRDRNWVGIRPVGLGDEIQGRQATTEDVDREREAWAAAFVDACVERKLEAISITDHHEMVMIPYVQKAIIDRKKNHPTFDLWLFPGMELTTHGGYQSLILFDADLSENWRQQAQGKLGILFADLEDKAPCGRPVVQITANYADLSSMLDELGAEIKGKYIILPNVSQGNAHTVLVKGHHADFLRMPYVGGYVDHGQNITTMQGSNIRRMSGRDPKWSNRFIYPLPTSDSRSSTYAHLGDNSCWIKLSTPTAEAIRQAFLGHQSRISITRPVIADMHVVSIRLTGSTILHDIDLNLSAELNSFIGGRGSGKSSLLEYIAFGLGRSCYDLQKEDYSGSERMNTLIKDTLISANGEIHIALNQDGALFQISRTPGNAYQPQVRYPNGSVHPLSAREIRSLFPSVVYSQGELSELGKQAGRKAQLSELLQFVDPNFKREDDELSATIEAAKLNARTAYQGLLESWRQQSELHKLETSKASLQQRILALQSTLPTLAEADQIVVKKFESLSAFEGLRDQGGKRAETVMGDLTKLWQLGAQPLNISSDLAEARRFIDVYNEFKAEFSSGLMALGKALAVKKKALDKTAEDWSATLQAARVARDAIMDKLGEHKTVTAQISALQLDVEGLTTKIGDLLLNSSSPDACIKVSNSAMVALKGAVAARGERTTAWAKQIETLSKGRIEAQLNIDSDWSEIYDATDFVAAKTGSQTESRQRQILETIKTSSAWQYLDSVRADCLSILHYKLVGSSVNGERPPCADLFRTLGVSDKTRNSSFELMDLPRLEAIATATPQPDITLSYCDNNRKISFEKASEGQRAAALLFMLLEQPGGPLFIDQPEGDLDNKVISDLTDNLHEAKKRRQIFFASHNANIVVNGSSELVSCLEMNDGRRGFSCSGAIDEDKVCKTITETMEGGEKAFRDRQSKYGY
jgi:chromosome segregation protein